ncbi:MAG: hypothetical protein KQA41_04440 [Candidatus Aenigmarchaeota archaeon]|nr:hypothetical protein [Candidatus Aenigmarchaeota archaeon]
MPCSDSFDPRRVDCQICPQYEICFEDVFVDNGQLPYGMHWVPEKTRSAIQRCYKKEGVLPLGITDLTDGSYQ